MFSRRCAMTSSSRPRDKPGPLEISEQGTVRLPPMAEGKNEFMLVRLDGDTPSHFSPIQKVTIEGTEGVIQQEADLVPAVRVEGKLSDNVSRPVSNGRVNVMTIPAGDSWQEVTWSASVRVATDGSFVISSWPSGEPMQLTALCDGFIAESGEAPAMVKPERAAGPHLRAQVFMNPSESKLTVQMTPMATCNLTVLNGFDKPIDGVNVASWPNIGWWNGGSQGYCSPMGDYVDFLRTGEYKRPDPDAPNGEEPFCGTTDEGGQVSIDLPVGAFRLYAEHKRYQLPIIRGDREVVVRSEKAGPFDFKMVMQPKGLDVLGDWEDLCGLVFG